MFVVGSQILERTSIVLNDLVRVMCRSHDDFRGLRRASGSRWEYEIEATADATAVKEKKPLLLAKVPASY